MSKLVMSNQSISVIFLVIGLILVFLFLNYCAVGFKCGNRELYNNYQSCFNDCLKRNDCENNREPKRCKLNCIAPCKKNPMRF